MLTTIAPFSHQTAAAEFILRRGGSGAIFHEIGLGKTRTALEVFKQMRKTVDVDGNFKVIRGNEPNLKLLVICPISLIEAAWGEDIKKFTEFSYCNLREGFKRADIYIVNYEMLLGAKLEELRILIVANKFMCVLDESSRMKNFKAKTTKTLLQLRKFFKYRIVMSGTPAPNLETEYWAQMMFVGDVFNPSFYAFRNNYFHLERGTQKFSAPRGQIVTREMLNEMFSKGWKYNILPQKKIELLARIAPYCHYAKKIDCLDLPDQLDEVRMVELGTIQRQKYKEMKNDLITEIKGKPIVAQVALAKIMKLREITSGFCLDEKGETYEIGQSAKMAELDSLLDETNEQMIIWAEFQWEINSLVELLRDRGSVETLFAGTKDKDTAINRFKGGEARFMVAHPRSAGHGLTFTNCSLEVFYSMSYSYELYEQCRGRIHRVGQKNNCTYVHLLAHNTIDEQIYKVVKDKRDAQEIVDSFLLEG